MANSSLASDSSDGPLLSSHVLPTSLKELPTTVFELASVVSELASLDAVAVPHELSVTHVSLLVVLEDPLVLPVSGSVSVLDTDISHELSATQVPSLVFSPDEDSALSNSRAPLSQVLPEIQVLPPLLSLFAFDVVDVVSSCGVDAATCVVEAQEGFQGSLRSSPAAASWTLTPPLASESQVLPPAFH